MNSLVARKSQTSPVSGRATVAHLGRAQQPQPSLVSGRALVGQLGISRRYTGTVNLLQPYPLALGPAPLPDFNRLRAQAQQLQGQLARYDTLAAQAPAPVAPRPPAPPPGPRLVLSTPAQRAARARFLAQKLADVNRLAQVIPFLPAMLDILRSPFLDARAKAAPPGPGGPGGPDSFMPASFWKSQNPDNDPKVGWALCCATVKAMLASVSAGKVPNARYDLVQEHRSTARAHGLRVRDGYAAAPNAARAARGRALLDECMALHRPVMVGVSHTVNYLFSKKNKKTGLTTYHEINDGTIDHFVAIVGVGVDKNGKYYRFFDVGTIQEDRGTAASNRFYLSTKSGFWEGTSQAMPGNTYVLTQLRFFDL